MGPRQARCQLVGLTCNEKRRRKLDVITGVGASRTHLTATTTAPSAAERGYRSLRVGSIYRPVADRSTGFDIDVAAHRGVTKFAVCASVPKIRAEIE